MEWLLNPDYVDLQRPKPHRTMPPKSEVVLRSIVNGPNQRHLWARLDDNGDLVVEGQDLGPEVEKIFGDNEYEWAHTIALEHIPQFLQLLGHDKTDDVLEVLIGFAGAKCQLVVDAIFSVAEQFPVKFWSRH